MWINYQFKAVCPLILNFLHISSQNGLFLLIILASQTFYPNWPIFLHGYIRHIRDIFQLWCPLKIIRETFRSPHPLFRNIQVINWHKYKESTNKNSKYVNSLFVCWGVIFQNSKVTRSIIWLLSQAHAFEHDSFLRNGRHGDVQHVQQKKSEYEIFMKREKIYLTFTFKGWFSSAILNFLFKNQTNCYWWFAYVDNNDDDYVKYTL